MYQQYQTNGRKEDINFPERFPREKSSSPAFLAADLEVDSIFHVMSVEGMKTRKRSVLFSRKLASDILTEGNRISLRCLINKIFELETLKFTGKFSQFTTACRLF